MLKTLMRPLPLAGALLSGSLFAPSDTKNAGNRSIYQFVKNNAIFESTEQEAQAIDALFLLLDDVFADFSIPDIRHIQSDDEAIDQLIQALRSKLDRSAPQRSTKAPAVGHKDAYELQHDKSAWLSTLTDRQQELFDRIITLTGYNRPSAPIKASHVVLITPGAHGIRVNTRLDIIRDWQQQHPHIPVIGWYVVTGDRVMNDAEHNALRDSVHRNLSADDIQQYGRNENDYWSYRMRWHLQHTERYQSLNTFSQSYVTSGIDSKLQLKPAGRSTTKDNAFALAEALTQAQIPADATIVIAVEAPFTTRMSAIFSAILKWKGINQPVIGYHGTKTMTAIQNDDTVMQALGTNVAHIKFSVLNELYMNFVERKNCTEQFSTANRPPHSAPLTTNYSAYR